MKKIIYAILTVTLFAVVSKADDNIVCGKIKSRLATRHVEVTSLRPDLHLPTIVSNLDGKEYRLEDENKQLPAYFRILNFQETVCVRFDNTSENTTPLYEARWSDELESSYARLVNIDLTLNVIDAWISR